MPEPDLKVQVAPGHPDGLLLRNPVMIASGTFGRDGYGAGLPPGMDYQELGALVAKTATPLPRQGNPRPRTAHGPGWFLNSIGLENPGIDAVLRDHAPRWAAWRAPVILSIAGERVEEFAALAAAADGTPGVAALEVNVSCPNVEGGLEFGQSPDLTEEVTRRVRDAASLPVIVKLSPNVTSIVPIAQAAARGGAHALTLVNTLSGMAMDRGRQGPLLGAGAGGVSGPALKPVALAMVYIRAYEAVDPWAPLPLERHRSWRHRHGGGRDVLDFLMAGACAVQVGISNPPGYAQPVGSEPLHVLRRSGLERHGFSAELLCSPGRRPLSPCTSLDFWRQPTWQSHFAFVRAASDSMGRPWGLCFCQQEAPPSRTRRGFARSSLFSWRSPRTGCAPRRAAPSCPRGSSASHPSRWAGQGSTAGPSAGPGRRGGGSRCSR